MRRPFLVVLLGFGVLFGYGSAIGSAVRHHRWAHGEYAQGECGGGSWGRWSQRYEPPAPVVTAPAPAPAPAPVQQQQQMQAPATVVPQIIIVQPQAAPSTPAPTVIVQQPQVQPTPPAKAEPAAKAPSAE